MASLHIVESSFASFSFSRLNPHRKPTCKSCFDSEFTTGISVGRRCFKFWSHRSSRFLIKDSSRIFCKKLEEDGDRNNGEEPPESLFMRELKRRGMTPTSLLEESGKSSFGDEGIKFMEEDGGFSRRNAVSTDYEKSLSSQREQSMALNSEGLEGLIPRAKLLLTIGGTFFLGFGPLILITVGFFSALYLYFGPSFIHDASTNTVAPPPYIDPYDLLKEERISQIPPLN